MKHNYVPQCGPIVYARESIGMWGEEDINHVRDKTGRIVLQQYEVDHLFPGRVFVIFLKIFLIRLEILLAGVISQESFYFMSREKVF